MHASRRARRREAQDAMIDHATAMADGPYRALRNLVPDTPVPAAIISGHSGGWRGFIWGRIRLGAYVYRVIGHRRFCVWYAPVPLAEGYAVGPISEMASPRQGDGTTKGNGT